MRRAKAGGRGPARERVLEALRQGPRAVDEVARELGVTRNAVRVHLHALVRDGLALATGLRPGRRRPFRTYALTASAEALSGRAYVPLADQLLRAAEAAVPRARRRALLRSAGRGLAGSSARGPISARVRVAAHRLEELGATTRVEKAGGSRFVIQGSSCPLTAVVRAHPEVCLAVEAFVSEVTRCAARETCDRSGDVPRCRIEVEA
jgi:predicted ArsR family transcriptional regulator